MHAVVLQFVGADAYQGWVFNNAGSSLLFEKEVRKPLVPPVSSHSASYVTFSFHQHVLCDKESNSHTTLSLLWCNEGPSVMARALVSMCLSYSAELLSHFLLLCISSQKKTIQWGYQFQEQLSMFSTGFTGFRYKCNCEAFENAF